MRTYVVQAGDSPAKIAIQYAQCPKCAADLVAANPQKQSVRYPNGFLTFSSLHIGEKLNLPDKWFNGHLDALPKEYFEALPAMPGPQDTYLPQMATQAGGVGQAPGYAQAVPFNPSPGHSVPYGPSGQAVPYGPSGQAVPYGRHLTPANPILFRPPVATPTPCPPGYSQVQLTPDTYECVPNSSFVIPGTLQTPVPEYRGTTPIGPRPVGVGATFKPAPIRPPAQSLAPQRPTAAALAVALQAYNNGSYLLGSGATIPQAVAAFLYSAQSSLAAWTAIGKPGSIGAIVAQIQQFQSYVGPGDLNVGLQAQNLAYAAMGTAGSTINPFGGVSGRADGVGVGRTLKPGNPILLRPPGTGLGLQGPFGVGANPPPPAPPPDYSAGIPVPNGPSQATSADFIPEHTYDMVVWPIPQGPLVQSEPGKILQDMGFDVSVLTYNDPAAGGDGSYSVTATYTGSTDYIPDPTDGLNILVFYQGSQQSGGPPYVLMTAGNTTVPGNQLVVLPPPGQTWVSLTLDGNIPVNITGPTDPIPVTIGGAGQATTGQLVAVTTPTTPIPLINGSTPADILYNYLITNGCNCDPNTGHPQAQYVADFQSSIGVNNPSGYYGPNTQGSLQNALNQEGNGSFVAPMACYGTDQAVKGQFPPCTAYGTPNGQQTTTLNVTVQGGANPSGTTAFLAGETVKGVKSGVTATVAWEYDDTLSQGWGVLAFTDGVVPFLIGETIRGQQSNGAAVIAYQYPIVMNDIQAGTLGVTVITDNGSIQQLPYNAQPGDKLSLIVRPMLDAQGNLPDPVAILANAGLGSILVGTMNPDCTIPIQATNTTANPIAIDAQMMDVSTGDSMWVTSLTANGITIATPPAPAQQIGGPIMRACHSFTFTYVPKVCPTSTAGGGYDPTVGLAQLGFTNFTPPTTGPDVLGQYTITGVWELGDGFQLPTSADLTITGYTDNGPATNVQSGVCSTSLPYTLQPGDTVNLIVRPIAVPGQPMSNPVAVLQSLGFTNIAPAATYSDCTWSITATYTGGASPIPGSPPGKPLQVTDPLVSPGFGAMWIVGMSVNSTTVKDANWAQLTEIPLDLDQCNAYSILFTFDVCPALTGAPGSWDPSAAVQAILPGFKVAPGPNEYGEWTASGVWTGASVKGFAGSGGIHFTFLVNFGASQGCTVTPPACPTGQIADTVTKACVAPCLDGSAPANGVCPPPVKATGPCPTAGQVRDTQTGACVAPCGDGSAPSNGVCPVVAPAAPTSTATTVAAVGAAVVILGGVTYLALT